MNTNKHVFVVDDDSIVRDSLCAVLNADGYKACGFESAQAFLDAYTPGEGGCLIVDVQMPEISGLELQARLADLRVDVPVIVITGHGDVPKAVQALQAGAHDFIEKPFTDEIILNSVRRSLARREQSEREKTRAQVAAAGLELLTARERDVLEQLVTGQPNKVIAYELGISPRTVEIHRARVMKKMQARNLPHLVRLAMSVGINPS